MEDVVEIDIDVPQAKLAELYSNPENNTKWMDDVETYEPLSGEPGMPGSTYRLIPKKGKMIFLATVVAQNLPHELRLSLDAYNVTVSVKGTLVPLSSERTRLISEEEFRFKGLFNRIFGVLAQSAIRKAHRRHMEAFKRFAEGQ